MTVRSAVSSLIAVFPYQELDEVMRALSAGCLTFREREPSGIIGYRDRPALFQ